MKPLIQTFYHFNAKEIDEENNDDGQIEIVSTAAIAVVFVIVAVILYVWLYLNE